MRRGDSICGNTFRKLVEEKGYPEVIQIGLSRKVSAVPSTILWHGAVTSGGRNYYNESFRKLLRNALEMGRMSPSDFAISEDRHTYGKTCYGSIGIMGLDLPSVALCDTLVIDSARRSIGLESLEMLEAKRANKDHFFLNLFR